MALFKLSPGQSPDSGRLMGQVMAVRAGQQVVAACSTPANKSVQKAFRSWTNPAPWAERWTILSAFEKAQWVTYAAANKLFRWTGLPRKVSGEVHFVKYWSQAAVMNGADLPGPYDPPASPVWIGSNQPFYPFMDARDEMAIVVKEPSDFPRRYFFTGQPPLPGQQKLTRATTVPVGSFTLEPCESGFHWKAPMAAMVSRYGPMALDRAMQQWLQVWQLDEAWTPRVVLDPCYTPPPTQGLAARYEFNGPEFAGWPLAWRIFTRQVGGGWRCDVNDAYWMYPDGTNQFRLLKLFATLSNGTGTPYPQSCTWTNGYTCFVA